MLAKNLVTDTGGKTNEHSEVFMKQNNIFIIGGGAAGIVAAISARRLGANVTILERNPRIGKKILATGNGRCNYTNINTEVAHYSGNNPDFVKEILAQFTVSDTINFFTKLGISPLIEDKGKVFPRSEQASSILDVFLYELNELGVRLKTDTLVKAIHRQKGKYLITTDNGEEFIADKVIITTGGKAMPSSGSDGRGYDLAEGLGHSTVEIFPALVQLKLAGDFFKQIAGVKIVGTAELILQDKILSQDRGDILFTNYGISGPPILQLSRLAGQLLKDGAEPELKISLIDNLTAEALKNDLENRWQTKPDKPLDFSLVGLINKRLIPIILKNAGITKLKKSVSTLTPAEQARILNSLTDFRLKIRGTKGFTSAQVTAGGINTDEINPLTLESKINKGLYFAGEIIDIDGECGGYNLQWAWSSGYIAGQNAAY